TVYLLAKELAYDVVNNQTDKLTTALANTSGKDFVQFAKAVEISHSSIGEKVCKTKQKDGRSGHFAKYGEETHNNDGSHATVAVCGEKAGHNSGGSVTVQTLKDFVKETLKADGNRNWPTSRENSGNNNTRPQPNDNAKAVAKDLVEQLSSDEKIKVAGLLARTIEGGEVVEIRAVSSTSVMVNACYDLLSEGLGVVPYACVGLGGNFVGVLWMSTARSVRLRPYMHLARN
ncbi:P44/Msp2 family outer membrane protein, partial [Anaplasma phagocytophilum]|uniref:P44/Msp2 family outer membrane protein n=1 Tax=Anaplasma phagocytophilum TaxID=948 RepID=UPI000B2D3906